uniref:Uncharacterized protein n=1 Tax=viral metagenome TaxID=1070528 RepID=A0A6C0D2L4_9ZZZZ
MESKEDYYYPSKKETVLFARQLQQDLTKNTKLKKLIERFYPERTPLQRDQKLFLIQHVDEMRIPMYEDQMKKLEKILMESKKGTPNTQQIINKGRGIKQLWERRKRFENAILSLPPTMNPNHLRLISYLYSINYPHLRFRDEETKAMVETFIEKSTFQNAKKIEDRFRGIQSLQQRRVEEEREVDELMHGIGYVKQQQQQQQQQH